MGVLGFLENFTGNFVLSDETRLMVCERPKFAKSAKVARISELNMGEKWNYLVI